MKDKKVTVTDAKYDVAFKRSISITEVKSNSRNVNPGISKLFR